jgi:iron complex outermembrane receptor protein
MRLVIAMGMLLASAVVHAQDEAAQAKNLYEKGMAHYQLEEWDAAIEKWEAGFRLRPVPEFLYNIAQAHRLAKRFEKSVSFYRKYLNMNPKAPNRAEVERHIASLNKAIEEQKRASGSPPTAPIATDTGRSTPKPVEPAPRPVEPAPKPVAKPVEPAPRPVEPVVAKPAEPAPAAVVASAPPKDDRPIPKKGWFWGVIGGVGVVVVAAVVVGAVIGTQDNTPVLSPARF